MSQEKKLLTRFEAKIIFDMDWFKEFFREHKMAVSLAILASIIVAFPQVYLRFDYKVTAEEKGLYQGIELLPDSPWSPRVREIQDGHNLGSIYYKDGKTDPYLFQPFGSAVVAYMGKIFSLEINNTLLFSRVVLTFVSFLSVYIFAYLFFRRKAVALCSSSIILLAGSLLSYSSIKSVLRGLSPEDFLEIARPVNPAMIYIIFFGFLAIFWFFYENKNWKYGVLSSLFLGLNFYNYFYSWTFLYAFGGLLTLILIFQKNWNQAIKVVAVFSGALIALIPYALNLYRATLHPAYEEASLRFGVVETNTPLFVGFVVIAALAIFIYGFPRENKEKYFFALALLLTPFITLNQQLLTGKILQPAHYHWYFHKPIAVIFVLMVIFYLFNRPKLLPFKKILAVSIIFVSFSYGIFVQAFSYYHGGRDGGVIAIERQKYGPVVEWLNKNAKKEDVVVANNETSHMIVVYTPLNVFYHRAAMYSLAATENRLMENIFSFYRLRGVDGNEAEKLFFKERGYISWNIYGMHYREVFGDYGAIPDEKVSGIIELYKKTLVTPTSKWLKDLWNKNEVEYVVWDINKDKEWHLDDYTFLKKEIVLGDIIIYKFLK